MLRLTVGARWVADLARPIDLSIPLEFDGRQPNAFGLPPATAQTVVATAEGGPVNCVTVTLNPHGNGTHTECAAHVFSTQRSVATEAPLAPVGACLLTVSAEDGAVQAEALEAALIAVPAEFRGAVVLRTGVRDPWANHTGANPTWLHPDAARVLRKYEVQHLLVDVPSVDPEDDGGAVLAHKIFFECADQRRTITEMVRIGAAPDGLYVLALQVPAFIQDAAPSRPVLFPVREIEGE